MAWSILLLVLFLVVALIIRVVVGFITGEWVHGWPHVFLIPAALAVYGWAYNIGEEAKEAQIRKRIAEDRRQRSNGQP